VAVDSPGTGKVSVKTPSSISQGNRI